MLRGEGVARSPDRRERLLTPLEEECPLPGQADGARGAGEQRLPDVRFERRDGLADGGGPFFSKLFGIGVTEAEAASRYVKVGTEPVEGGGYYYEGVLRPAPKQAQDKAFVDATWALVQAQTRQGKKAA